MANLIYKELSYKVNGILFCVHNELGCFAREKQYADLFEKLLTAQKVNYKREVIASNSGNRFDFIIEDKIIVELKVASRLTNEYFRQIQNYLQVSQLKLGLLVNFRNHHLKPVRIIRINS